MIIIYEQLCVSCRLLLCIVSGLQTDLIFHPTMGLIYLLWIIRDTRDLIFSNKIKYFDYLSFNLKKPFEIFQTVSTLIAIH